MTKFSNGVLIYGQSLTLDGSIGVNVYVAAPDGVSWMVGFDDKILKKPAKDNNGLYKFTYSVSAKDMSNQITFSLNGEEIPVSVAGYIGIAEDTIQDTKTRALVKAMKNYGEFANAYFNTIETQTTLSESANAVDFTGMEKYTPTIDTANMPDGLTYYGSSLLLKSTTTVRHYFTVAEGKASSGYIVSGATSSELTLKSGNLYYVDVENISAENLDTAYEVTVSAGGKICTVSNYSAMSYVKSMGKKTTDTKLVDLLKTLVDYNNDIVNIT